MSNTTNDFLKNALTQNGANEETITNLDTEIHTLHAQLDAATQKIGILVKHNIDAQLELANQEEVITSLKSEIAHLSQHIHALTHKLSLSVEHTKGFISENADLHKLYGNHLKAAHLMLAAAKNNIEKLQKKSQAPSAKTSFIEDTKKKPNVSPTQHTELSSKEQDKPSPKR